MNIDLELYRIFCEVVKHKNISKTAESMYISQSAITQSIQKLEKTLGGKVFYRNKTGVELTEEGKNLYEYIKNSIETMNNAENIFSKYINLDKGSVRIGGGNSLLPALLLEPLLAFIKKYPHINVSISSGIIDILMQQLVNGELDIVTLNLTNKNKKYSNVEYTTLKNSNFSFFASKQYIKEHPIKNFEEVFSHPLILPKSPSSKKKMVEEYCAKENIPLVYQYEVSNSSLMKKLVLNDIGIGFTNTENIKDIGDDIEVIKQIEAKDSKLAIATLKKNMCNKATLEFVNEIKQYYK